MATSTSDLNAGTGGNFSRYLTWTSVRSVLFWICTLAVAFEMIAGGVWDLLEIEYVRVILAHLGYPNYLLVILGVWKIPCALALLVARFRRLKEWAYAGAFFTYSGAAASHFLTGDNSVLWTPPLVLLVLTLGSWALRPAERRLISGDLPDKKTSVLAWVVPLAMAVVFLILAVLNLPVGPPPALGGK